MDWRAGAVKGWMALTNLGVFAVAGTIIGFWYSIGDRAADRHQNAWQVVRDAISWSDRGGTGNLGQVKQSSSKVEFGPIRSARQRTEHFLA